MFIEKIVGDLGDKRRWRAYKARVKALPPSYRTAAEALERYLMHVGGIAKSDVLLTMVDDLADLFERAAVDETPIRTIVGDDPVEFAEEFLENYSDGRWINKERDRLSKAIETAEAQAGETPA